MATPREVAGMKKKEILNYLNLGISAFAIGLGVSWGDWWIIGFGCIWLVLTTIRIHGDIESE